jgi:hypothetical protein
MDGEDERFPQRFKDIDAQATGLGAGGYIDPKQLIAKGRFFARQRLKAHDTVNGQALLQATSMPCGSSALRRNPGQAILANPLAIPLL